MDSRSEETPSHSEQSSLKRSYMIQDQSLSVGPGLLHGNLHFARQFRCFTAIVEQTSWFNLYRRLHHASVRYSKLVEHLLSFVIDFSCMLVIIWLLWVSIRALGVMRVNCYFWWMDKDFFRGRFAAIKFSLLIYVYIILYIIYI